MPDLHNWRSIGFIAAVPVIGAGFLVFTRGLSRPDPSATLTGKLERLVGDWTVNKVPVNSRVVNLIIGEASSSEDVLSLPEPPPAPSVLDKLKGLLGLRASGRAVNVPNPFADAFAKDKNAITWTFDGFSKADEKAVIEELAKNIVNAHDAQAELNIVARGAVGAAVLKAVKSLEGQVRDGVPVGVNSFINVGMDLRRQKDYDPEFFAQVKRPSNLGQWANIYAPGMRVEDGAVEMWGKNFDGKELPGKFLTGLLPAESRLSSSGLPIRRDALALAITGVFSRSGGLEQYMTQQEWQEERRLEEERRQAAEGEARRRAEEEARRRAEEDEARRRAAAEEARRKAAEAAERRAARAGKWPIEGKTAKVQWVDLPGGSFMMGMESRYSSSRAVTVRAFKLAKTEVTNAQYRACVQAGACEPPHDGCGGEKFWGNDQPVVCVDLYQAQAFAKWAGGRLPSLDSHRVRRPNLTVA